VVGRQSGRRVAFWRVLAFLSRLSWCFRRAPGAGPIANTRWHMADGICSTCEKCGMGTWTKAVQVKNISGVEAAVNETAGELTADGTGWTRISDGRKGRRGTNR
jgi:hypothetical protein